MIVRDEMVLKPKILEAGPNPSPPREPCPMVACWAWCVIEHFWGCGCLVAFSDCGPWKVGPCLPPNLY